MRDRPKGRKRVCGRGGKKGSGEDVGGRVKEEDGESKGGEE